MRARDHVLPPECGTNPDRDCLLSDRRVQESRDEPRETKLGGPLLEPTDEHE
jgi:hypothetical protein